MRLFIGIPIPEKNRNKIKDSTRRLISDYPEVKWVKKNGIHITLFFIGKINPVDIQEILSIFNDPLLKTPPFRVEYSGIEQFPPEGTPKVFYTRIDRGGESCRDLYRFMADNFSSGKKKYSPHITLARVKEQKSYLDILLQGDGIKGSFTADKIVLYESVLFKEGSEYKEIAVRYLKK